MAVPTTRAEFKEYVLRKLGAPVIEINLSDEQIEDRIDEALYFFRDYHYDGAELVYLKHQLTQTDIDNGYIDLPTNLVGAVRIFNTGSSLSTGSGMFSATYQFVFSNMQTILDYDIDGYYMSMQQIAAVQEWLVGQQLVRYNRHSNRMYIDIAKNALSPGQYLIIEAYDRLAEDSDIWSDRWLQNYTAALIKENWGSVLTKFSNIQLMGGVMYNGEQILSEAREERKAMEEEAIRGLQPLVFNFIG